MVESRSKKQTRTHTRTRSHSPREHELEGLSVGAEKEEARPHAARSATLLSSGCRCVEAGCITRLRVPNLPSTPSISHLPYYCEARSSAFDLCGRPACRAGSHSRVPSLSSVFCAALLHARAHRSGIFRPSSVSLLAVPTEKQLPTSVRLSSTSESLLETLFSPNAGQTSVDAALAPCALARFRSWNQEWLEPTPSHPHPTHCFAYSEAYFRAPCNLSAGFSAST